jgi:hypothetical protein
VGIEYVFMVIWYSLKALSTYTYVMIIWYIFFLFGKLYQENSGNLEYSTQLADDFFKFGDFSK